MDPEHVCVCVCVCEREREREREREECLHGETLHIEKQTNLCVNCLQKGSELICIWVLVLKKLSLTAVEV